MKIATKISFLLLATALFGSSAVTYQKPSKAVMDVLNSPATPTLSLSPTHTFAVQGQPVRYPPIAELSQPMLRLAGLRINPKTNGLHNTVFNSSLVLRKVPEGTEIAIQLPPDPKLTMPVWSPDGSHFAFTNSTANGIELWIGDTTGKTHKVEGVHINAVMTPPVFPGRPGGRFGGGGGGDVQWMPDSKTLLVYTVRSNRGAAPVLPSVPIGPAVQESLGGATPVVTHEDMLQNPHDEDLFEYYATAQLATVDLASGKVTPIGKHGILESVHISPGGKYFLVTTVHRPFSYLYAVRSFPKDIEIWDRSGKVVHKVASLPLEDKVPINGVITGPRSVEWRPSEPPTLIWAEALDGGNLKNSVPFRDHVLALKAPFTGEPTEVFKTEQRFQGIQMGEKGGLAFVEDFDRRKRWVRTFEVYLDDPNPHARVLWSRNNQDRYNDPGAPLEKRMPNGQRALLMDGDNIFLTGLGSSPKGDHPFLERFNLATQKSERLFQCDDTHYETVEGLLDAHGDKFLTRRESPTEPPNYFIRTAAGSITALTKFPDPQPSIRGVRKELVKYKRPDGVDLSFTLYLPPDYKQGTRLPTVIWAYPYEYNDAATAGQVTGSTNRFTEMTGYSELFFALDGYAVLANTAMPVVGADPDTVNNTYIDQIIADSKAAIDKAAEMGVTDPSRVGVGGHSYGAFMTANLLAHCDLFRAGIAESGAHNRTLTPFGFQTERRTLWEAPDVYLKMSPFMFANKIKAPILLIHGEADDNDGTFPIQSERMYEAIRGNGGTVRLVFLPFEAHGYRGKETIEHVLWEKFAWFDKYVKNAPSTNTTN
ncbi:MAG TPA: prolyl oligopeptidase family serine peptidase [Bryobacteraceae bacterium]|nr:prolyl oligopeptidase family serine peptidase [Bryobacteraceae bacterium]